MLHKLGYEKGQPLHFPYKRNCGLWLLIIGAVIVFATVLGGAYLLNPFVFSVGYLVGFYLANINRKIHVKLACGTSTKFQSNMGAISVTILFVLLFCIAGPFFITMNWRMIWLGAFLATGLHFLPFYFVHGKSMIVLAAILISLALAGILLPFTTFSLWAYLDGGVKVLFGIYLLFFSKPTTSG